MPACWSSKSEFCKKKHLQSRAETSELSDKLVSKSAFFVNIQFSEHQNIKIGFFFGFSVPMKGAVTASGVQREERPWDEVYTREVSKLTFEAVLFRVTTGVAIWCHKLIPLSHKISSILVFFLIWTCTFYFIVTRFYKSYWHDLTAIGRFDIVLLVNEVKVCQSPP